MNPEEIRPGDVYAKVLEQMRLTAERDAAIDGKLNALTRSLDFLTVAIYVLAVVVFVKLLIHVVMFVKNNRALNRLNKSLAVVEGHAKVNKSEREENEQAHNQATKLIDAGSAMAVTAAKIIEKATNGNARGEKPCPPNTGV